MKAGNLADVIRTSLLKVTLGMQARRLPAIMSWKRAESAPGS